MILDVGVATLVDGGGLIIVVVVGCGGCGGAGGGCGGDGCGGAGGGGGAGRPCCIVLVLLSLFWVYLIIFIH